MENNPKKQLFTGIIIVLVLAVLFYAVLVENFGFSFWGGGGSAAPSTPAQTGTDTAGGSGNVQASSSLAGTVPSLPSLPAGPTGISDSGTGSTGSSSGSAAQSAPVTAKKLPYTVSSFKDADWIKDWGTTVVVSGSLHFGAATDTTGGAAFLAGSDAWTNYDFESSITWTAGQSFSVIAREKDAQNFVYCDFGDHFASILQRVNDVDATIASGNTTNGGAGTSEGLGIRVYGNKVACTVSGVDVLTASVAGGPANGGVGFISWDKTQGTSAIVVKGLHVMALASDNITIAPPAPASGAAAITTVTVTSTPALAPSPSSTAASATTSTAASSASSVPLKIPFAESSFTGDANWSQNWGTVQADSSGLLDVGSNGASTGGTALLLHSASWTDYTFGATLNWLKGETFGLIARYTDGNNYVVCEYAEATRGDVTISLEQYLNGNEITLASADILNYEDSANTNATAYIMVQGTIGTCSLNNHVVSNLGEHNTINPPYSGMIGFTTWDRTPGNSQISVKNVNVKENY